MFLSCDLVIPCRDEGAPPEGLLRLAPGWLTVIVVEDGSGDDMAAVARPENSGTAA